MSNSESIERSGFAYRVRLLSAAKPTDRGILHRRGEEWELLEWSRFDAAIVAEVGEPEGVRTIVFDLIAGLDEVGCDVYRMDADPGEDAVEIARTLDGALRPDKRSASIRSMATDGTATRWYPDLETFEEAAVDALGG
jgi:hypothetical protein